MTADALLLEHVDKRFGEVHAVRDLSLRVPPGSIYGFLGPNGAGKTTTIRMIMSVFLPDSGKIRVLGSEDPLAVKDRLGYLPEEKGLYKKMRLAELIAFFTELKGVDGATARRRARELLDRFDLGEWADRRCESLSKGMAQKVQLLVTLSHEPELVILDEPFSGLDPVNRDTMRDVVLQLKRDGRTVIFSTHIMEQAEQICDHVLLINKGEKVIDGTVDEVRRGEGRAIWLDYDGESSRLQELPGVERVTDGGNRAELFLAAAADTQAVLAELVGRGVRVSRFDLRAPSLHEVFIRAVGGDASA